MLLTLILLTLFSSRMAFALSVLTYVLFSLSLTLTFALFWNILCVGTSVAMGTVVEDAPVVSAAAGGGGGAWASPFWLDAFVDVS